ncbi:MAG: hypothetical protein IJ038_00300 [Clostridia bacterium]|nr:hypothetical protein [Clostridia bacterium]
MNAAALKMSLVKGFGVGRSAVMGRLKKLRLSGADEFRADGESEWSVFSRVVGIAVSRVEEAYEYLEGTADEELCTLLCNMLELLRKREFLSEMRGMLEKGYGVLSAAEIMSVRENTSALREMSILFEEILGGFLKVSCGLESGEIAFYDREIDVTAFLAICRDGVSGIVCVGEERCPSARLAEILKIPALFVSKEDIEACAEGASAVLFPDKDTLYVSPEISVLDEFRARFGEELSYESGVLGDDIAHLGRAEIYSVRDILSSKTYGTAVEPIGNGECGEEKFFDIYRRLAEDSEKGELTVCIGRNSRGENYGDFLSEQLRAVCRAAVYGKISVAFSVISYEDYREHRKRFLEVCRELIAENREFDDCVMQGALIDRIEGALLADEICESADFAVVDTRYMIDIRKDERLLSADMNKIYGRMLSYVLDGISEKLSDIRVFETDGEGGVSEDILINEKTSFEKIYIIESAKK